jgi:hypothetical protein
LVYLDHNSGGRQHFDASRWWWDNYPTDWRFYDASGRRYD